MNKRITIIGATGVLGRKVAKNLVSKGVEVTAIVREQSIESAKKALPEAVKFVQGDVSKPESLVSALEGTDTLYITLNTTSLNPNLPFHTEREGVKNIVDAAKSNGVNHIMQIAGIDYLHEEFAEKGLKYKTNEIRRPGIEYIKESGINYTFFFCSFFLDSFPAFIQEGSFSIIGNHKNPIYYTNTTDLSEHIFNAIENEDAFNKSFPVQGEQAYSLPEAAKLFLDNYDPSIKIMNLPIVIIPELGLPSEEEAFMEHMLTYVEQLKEEQVSQETWRVLGSPKTTIESFAKELAEINS